MPASTAVTERLLDAKRTQGIRFDELGAAIGRDPVWTAALIYGQVSADRREAQKLLTELDIEDSEIERHLQRPPTKGEDDPTIPSDPMLYRLYEIPQVYGDAIKAVIHEEFGDGIMSAIDFECHVDRIKSEDGDRVRITYEGKFLPYRKF
ncbi:MAG: cyanase [Natronomonas sp.]